MVKHWDLYKSEINTLYITNGRSLEDVRRILRGRHNFDASIRTYRMKLEEWGMKKNKVPANLGKKVRLSTAATRSRSNFGAQPFTTSSSLHLDNNPASLSSSSTLEFQDHEAWPPPLNLSGSHGQGFGSSSLAVSHDFHNSTTAPYVDAAQVVDFASQQSLFDAISNGDEKEVKNLLSSGAPINIRDDSNNSLLHAAILKGNKDIVKTLLNYGADVDAVGFRGKTPLYLAVDSKPLAQLLLRHQPTLSIQDDDGNTILHHMLNIKNWLGDVDVRATMSSILSCGADVNIRNRHGESALHRVIADAMPDHYLYMQTALDFLNHNPDVLSPMRNGLALLPVFLDKSELLARSHIKRYGVPPWVIIGYRCLEQFLISGADPNTVLHSQPFIIEWVSNGIFEKNKPSEKALVHLIHKADIKVAGDAGNYPLHLCLARYSPYGSKIRSDFGIHAVTAALLARNANVNQGNNAGASPLEIWLKYGTGHADFMKVVLLLVEAGADTTKTTSTGKTLFDMLSVISSDEQIHLTKVFLRAHDKFQQEHGDAATRGEWVELWRSAWAASSWCLAKGQLGELQYALSRPKTREFIECASIVIMEDRLKVHQLQLNLWTKGLLEKEDVIDNYEEYCAILKDCRNRKADIDVSWYTFLLDLMDFK